MKLPAYAWRAAIAGAVVGSAGALLLALVYMFALERVRSQQEIQILDTFSRGMLQRADSALWKADTAIEDFARFERVMSSQLTQVRVQVKQSSDTQEHTAKVGQQAVAKAIQTTAAAVTAVEQKAEVAPIVHVDTPAPAPAPAPIVRLVPVAPAPAPIVKKEPVPEDTEKTPWFVQPWHWIKKPFGR